MTTDSDLVVESASKKEQVGCLKIDDKIIYLKVVHRLFIKKRDMKDFKQEIVKNAH